MACAPWRSMLDLALERHGEQPKARLVALATVRSDGRPANRTLVFRGFRAGTDQLCFATHQDSAKVEQLGRTGWAEVCWHFPQSQEQFRLLGMVRPIGAGDADAELQALRLALWRELPDTSRQQFTWPATGTPRVSDVFLTLPPPDSQTPLASFCVLLLDAVEVDHLELAAPPPPHWHYRRGDDGNWSMAATNP